MRGAFFLRVPSVRIIISEDMTGRNVREAAETAIKKSGQRELRFGVVIPIEQLSVWRIGFWFGDFGPEIKVSLRPGSKVEAAAAAILKELQTNLPEWKSWLDAG